MEKEALEKLENVQNEQNVTENLIQSDIKEVFFLLLYILNYFFNFEERKQINVVIPYSLNSLENKFVT
jgi:hypothetical protein